MNLSRQAPFQHPFTGLFNRAIETIGAPLSPQTERQYRGAARNFLIYLATCYPELNSLDQLRRDPHVLGWLAHLRSHTPPLAPITYILRILFLRGIFYELARTTQLLELAYLLRRQDVPRKPKRLPRPLTAEQDEALQKELLRRNDLAANVFLLLRHTGMRIGEAADLSVDCLHSTGTDQWAILVPLGKLKTERMVPVDSAVCRVIQRIRFFRSFDGLPDNGYLLPVQPSKQTFVHYLRDYLHEVTAAVGISTRIVPHQLRHTYATEMLRSGVSFPAIMKLLGHTSPDMTMLYLDIVITDLQREFQQARSHPRYLVPFPKGPAVSPRAGLSGVIDALLFAQHALEMFRRTLPDGTPRRCLDRLSNRLTKILSKTRKLATEEK